MYRQKAKQYRPLTIQFLEFPKLLILSTKFTSITKLRDFQVTKNLGCCSNLSPKRHIIKLFIFGFLDLPFQYWFHFQNQVVTLKNFQYRSFTIHFPEFPQLLTLFTESTPFKKIQELSSNQNLGRLLMFHQKAKQYRLLTIQFLEFPKLPILFTKSTSIKRSRDF